MDQTIETIKQQIRTGVVRGLDDMLEILYDAYSAARPDPQPDLKCVFRKLEDILKLLSFEERDEVLCAFNALCAVYERTAFRDGVRVGARVMLELPD